jgi:hypothetical protein
MLDYLDGQEQEKIPFDFHHEQLVIPAEHFLLINQVSHPPLL